jgi:pSer/pThr/pTyr-binding forkhead associated (FHA) protein
MFRWTSAEVEAGRTMSDPGGSKNQTRGVLEFVNGINSGELVKLRRDATILGREKGDIVLKDTEISSTHCQIQQIDGAYHIFDMNSTNGTFVNGQRIIKARLKPGDLITLGNTSIRFVMKEDGDLRNVATVFKTKKRDASQPVSVVDTLIESELRSTSNMNTLVLQIKYRTGLEEEIILKQRVVFIGRASSFGHFDQDPEISRRHLMIKLNDNGEVFIEDQGSTNGSRLNDQRISGMHLVRPNDRIKIGGTTIRIAAKAS